MKILVLTLITNGPDPVTGRTPTPNARLHRVIENAVLAEELGFDGGGGAARAATAERFGLPIVFPPVEDFVERSSVLIGSSQQILEKALRYHEVLGHEVLHVHLDGDGLTPRRQRAMLEAFQSEVAPAPRAAVPSRPLAGPVRRDPDDARPADAPVGVGR